MATPKKSNETVEEVTPDDGTNVLIKIQNEVKVPKESYNSFGKYKYRTAEQILKAAKPILLKYKASLVLTDDIVVVGNKLFLKATAEFTCGEESRSINGFAELSEHKGMSAEQTTGTASSFARKYALNGLLLLDETASDPDSVTPPAPVKVNAQQIAEITALATEKEVELSKVASGISKDRTSDITELTTNEASTAINMLKRK